MNRKDPYESPASVRDDSRREGMAVLSVVMALIAFLCLSYVWLQTKYPPAGRYYGGELIYFVAGALVLNIAGSGMALSAKHKVIGLICNGLVIAWNGAIFLFGVVP